MSLDADAGEIFLASTGVIGEPLDASKFTHLLAATGAGDATTDRWTDAAEAIMTTDTYPKVATATARLGDATVTINGIAKGAGMIAPDMATMLSFVVTDAPIAAPALQAMLAREWARPSMPSRSTATRRPPTRCCCLRRARRQTRGAGDHRSRRPARRADFRAALGRVLKDLALAGGARWRGRAQD